VTAVSKRPEQNECICRQFQLTDFGVWTGPESMKIEDLKSGCKPLIGFISAFR